MAKKQKMKTKKSIKRRFKVTKTGKVLRRGSHIRHLKRKKSKSRLRRQKLAKEVKGAWKRKVKKLLGE
jgi:large subunit ribosomal protein L35